MGDHARPRDGIGRRLVAGRLRSGGELPGSREIAVSFADLVGFTRLGVNPLKTLKDNIPNYQYLREQSSSPSRFSHYD